MKLALAFAALLLAAPPVAADFHKQRFDRPTRIDNRWLPLRPGTQLVYTGTTAQGTPHRIVTTVTDLVKVVGGVRNVVVWERDFSAGRLVEAELSFFAQDDAGTVWHTGEYPEAYEHGRLVEAPAWVADVKGAYAGIEMHARPRLGDPPYEQGYAPPPVSWTDHGQVHAVARRVCVPAGCFADVLVVREYNPDEPGRSQLKFYAPGVGNVRVGYLGREADRETLVLARIVHLDAAGLAAARAAALRLEARAYRLRPAVYGATPPARRSR